MTTHSRVLGVLTSALLTTAVASSGAPAADTATPGPAASREAHTITAAPVAVTVTVKRCATPAPTTAAGYQRMFNGMNTTAWSGGDQASTLRLPDGRTLWLFADTIQGAQDQKGNYAWGARMVHNSFVLQDRGCLRAVNGPNRREVIPSRGGQHYWPQHAVVDGGKLVVFATRVKRTGKGPMDFAGTGVDAAVFALPKDRTALPRFVKMVPTPASSSPETRPHWGQAVASDGKYRYLYGTAKVNQAYHFGKAVYLARVPVGKVLDRTQWRYWTGRTWSAQPAAATPVVKAAPNGWSTSFSVHRTAAGRYQMITKENDTYGTTVITGSAATPVGPFTRSVVGKVPSLTARRPTVTYNPMLHPELKVTGGALAHISRNTTSLKALSGNADLYKPQFFTVPAR